MDLSSITISFHQVVTFVLLIAYVVRVESRTMNTHSRLEVLEKKVSDGEKSFGLLVERLARVESKIDILLDQKI